jgi:hypothetical protein
MVSVRVFCLRLVRPIALLPFLYCTAQSSPQPVSEAKTSQTHIALMPAQPQRLPSGLPSPRATPDPFKSPVRRKLWDATMRHNHNRSEVLKLSDTSVLPFLTTPPMYAAGSDPFDLALGDFNGDGNQDVILADNPPALLLGNGDGTFQAAAPIGSIGSTPTGVAVADFNRDGKLDVAFAIYGGVVLYFGNGDGTFGAGTTISSGGTNDDVFARVLVVDVNNDGIADLVLNTDAGISVLPGVGNGTFRTSKSSPGMIEFMSAADFNKDGRMDLAVTDGADSLIIMLGKGDGTFVSSASYSINPSFFDDLAVSDFNGDGFPDVALPNGQLFLGKGNGTLRSPINFPTVASATIVAAVDVNGDGIADLLTASSGQQCSMADFGNTAVALGNGDGTFQAASVFDSGGCRFRVFAAVGDLNNDGAGDVAVLSGQNYLYSSTPQISVLLNQGDGTFPTARLNIAGGSGEVATDDFNHDGNADLVLADGSVYLGQGDGTLRFLAKVSLGGVAIATGDFNTNGNPDLAAAVECASADCSSGGQLLIASGLGTGRFQPPTALPSGGFYAESLVVADFNNDGKLDIAVVNNCTDSACSTGGSVAIYLGNGNAKFNLSQTIDSISGFPLSVVAGDFNNDGVVDLVVAGVANPGNFGPGVVNVLLGNGDGSFQPPLVSEPSESGDGVTAGFVADINNDGILDLILAYGAACNDCNGHGRIMFGKGDGTFTTGPSLFTAGGPPVSVVAADFYGNGSLTPVLNNRCGDSADCPGGSVMIDGTQNITDIMMGYLAVGDFNNDGKPDLAGSLQFDTGATVLLNVGATISATTTTVSPSAPSSYLASQRVTFAAQIHHTGPGTPTNTVAFLDNGLSIGSAQVDGAGTASITTSTLSVGSHFVVPYYNGDGSFAPSNALGVRVTVGVPTATTITSSENPSYPNQVVTFTAEVTSQGGPALTGSVTFMQGKTPLAVVPLSNGGASCSTTYTTSGVHQITALYSGDSKNIGSASAALRQITGSLPAVTTTEVTSSNNPSFVNQPVTFTATITSPYGQIPDGEIITFLDGVNPIGSAATKAGMATFSTSSLTAKVHTINARYAGDANLKPSSNRVQQTVSLYSSTTTLTSSSNPSTKGQTVMLTARVSSGNPKAPTGQVTFKDGTQTRGSAQLSGGVAMLNTSKLPAGMNSITAAYDGDSATAKSTSATVNQAVQ